VSWHWVESKDDLYDFLAQVIVCAPDDFIEVDYVPADEQLNLERAFDELHRGMEYLKAEMKDAKQIEALERLLDESLQAYRKGNDVRGAHLLQDFEEMAFKAGSA
jgi:exonuclease VII small subunit